MINNLLPVRYSKQERASERELLSNYHDNKPSLLFITGLKLSNDEICRSRLTAHNLLVECELPLVMTNGVPQQQQQVSSAQLSSKSGAEKSRKQANLPTHWTLQKFSLPAKSKRGSLLPYMKPLM